ncbi:MAG: hypothetical protein WA095_02025 [Minisyncoccia bacterium]
MCCKKSPKKLHNPNTSLLKRLFLLEGVDGSCVVVNPKGGVRNVRSKKKRAGEDCLEASKSVAMLQNFPGRCVALRYYERWRTGTRRGKCGATFPSSERFSLA